MRSPSSQLLILAFATSCAAFTMPAINRRDLSLRHVEEALSMASKEVDVSDLGLTMEDLEAPLPSELLQGIATSGYESTSRISTVDDDGCNWTENEQNMDVTLTIPGLRGQPAACLAVVCSKTTVTITAFGRPVWSCILKGEVDPDSDSFVTEDGADMIPVIQLSVTKSDTSKRWGGFIEQIGEDSIL